MALATILYICSMAEVDFTPWLKKFPIKCQDLLKSDDIQLSQSDIQRSLNFALCLDMIVRKSTTSPSGSKCTTPTQNEKPRISPQDIQGPLKLFSSFNERKRPRSQVDMASNPSYRRRLANDELSDLVQVLRIELKSPIAVKLAL